MAAAWLRSGYEAMSFGESRAYLQSGAMQQPVGEVTTCLYCLADFRWTVDRMSAMCLCPSPDAEGLRRWTWPYTHECPRCDTKFVCRGPCLIDKVESGVCLCPWEVFHPVINAYVIFCCFECYETCQFGEDIIPRPLRDKNGYQTSDEDETEPDEDYSEPHSPVPINKFVDDEAVEALSGEDGEPIGLSNVEEEFPANPQELYESFLMSLDQEDNH